MEINEIDQILKELYELEANREKVTELLSSFRSTSHPELIKEYYAQIRVILDLERDSPYRREPIGAIRSEIISFKHYRKFQLNKKKFDK